MPCPADDFSGDRFDSHSFTNWLGNVNVPVASYFQPDSLEALVWIMERAYLGDHHLKVVGSGWSFENIAASREWMVDLRHLNHILDHFNEDVFTTESPLTLDWARRITRPESKIRLVHVEAGIQLIDLNTQLHSFGLALPTLGGSQGQTLAGAINTSTHGGDLGITPFPDIVRAVHLVTTHGREMWVESASDPLTMDEGLRRKLACPDVEIIRDDDLLKALQVSVGRFGVIYSYVLEIRTRFDLVEWAVPSTWDEVSALLREGVASGDLFGPLFEMLPRPSGRAFEHMDIPLDDSDVNPRPRFLEFLMNSRDMSQLFVRRRWPLTTRMDLAVPGDPAADFLASHEAASGMLKATASIIRLNIPLVAGIPFYGIGRSIYMEARAAELDIFALDPHVTRDFAMVAAINALWACDEWGMFGAAIDLLIRGIFDGRPEIARDGKRGVSWQIMSGLSGDAGDTKVNSIEMIFDATTTNYIDFLDILAREGHGFQQAGYISVRYSKKSEALLSMHNVDGRAAVAIEVTSLRGFTQNDRWMRFIESRGIDLGGRPHWGQHNTLQAWQVMRLYGDKAENWREQLLRVVGTSATFSNDYTDQRGLEPFGIIRDVTAVRRAHGRITHLVNPAAYWSPIPVEEVITAFESDHVIEVGSSMIPRGIGRIIYQTRPADPTIRPGMIIVTHTLMTEADDTRLNNLRSLPLAREHYRDPPPPELRRRRVTSVVRNSGGGVTALCNDEERWRVLDGIAFAEIRSGMIEYFVDRGGTATNLVTRTNLATFADGITENNLDNLPDG